MTHATHEERDVRFRLNSRHLSVDSTTLHLADSVSPSQLSLTGMNASGRRGMCLHFIGKGNRVRVCVCVCVCVRIGMREGLSECEGPHLSPVHTDARRGPVGAGRTAR